MVHNGDMPAKLKVVRQSLSIPGDMAARVRLLAKARRLSSNKVILSLIESGMEAEKRKEQTFFELAERFRNATDPDEVKKLGNQMGEMVFGG